MQPDRRDSTTTARPRVVHLSNLCTEILEVTDQDETAVCNLGSINLGAFVAVDADGDLEFDFAQLGTVVRPAVPFLDRVIDINYYPTDRGRSSRTTRWRPVGLGLMGLQDVFFKLRLPFDSRRRHASCRSRSARTIYFHALWASTELAEANGAAPGLRRAPGPPQGDLQFDLWRVTSAVAAGRARLGRAARPASPSTACATRC